MTASQLMAGKRGLIMGVANDHSIAWGIAKELHRHGAELALPIRDQLLKKGKATGKFPRFTNLLALRCGGP